MSDEIKQLVSGLMEAWNAHDIERVATFYSSNYEGTDVSEANPQHGPDGIRQTVSRYIQAFPDIQFTPEKTVIQGNQVALFWKSLGTHRGSLMNIPPTGRVVSVKGCSLLTLDDNKVAKAEYIWDVAGLLRAIGLLPELS